MSSTIVMYIPVSNLITELRTANVIRFQCCVFPGFSVVRVCRISVKRSPRTKSRTLQRECARRQNTTAPSPESNSIRLFRKRAVCGFLMARHYVFLGALYKYYIYNWKHRFNFNMFVQMLFAKHRYTRDKCRTLFIGNRCNLINNKLRTCPLTSSPTARRAGVDLLYEGDTVLNDSCRW